MSEIPEVAHLRRALRLIQKGWCKNAFALDENRNQRSPTNPKAVCYCASGATWATDRTDNRGQKADYYLTRALPFCWGHVVDYNDAPERTKDEVIALFRKAINLARGVRVGQSPA